MATHLERLIAARDKAAHLVLVDPVYAPIFERLEAELHAADTTRDAITRARAIALAQRAIG